LYLVLHDRFGLRDGDGGGTSFLSELFAYDGLLVGDEGRKRVEDWMGK
jgi:hypothetical protein